VIHHEARHPTPASISLRSRFADPPPPGEGETSRPSDARHRPCCLRRGGAVASFSVLSRAWGLPPFAPRPKEGARNAGRAMRPQPRV
jgi:hypothetical protein